MADYKHLIAQLDSVAEDPSKLDGDTRKRIFDASISLSTKLLNQPPKEQSDILNESFAQNADLWLLPNGNSDMTALTAPFECGSLPISHEAIINDPRAVGFSQQSAATLPPSFGSYAIRKNHEVPDYNTLGMSFNQQHAQDSQSSIVFNDLSHDWSPSFTEFPPSMTGFVSPSLLSDSSRERGLVNTAYDSLPLDLTADLYNDFDTTGPIESSADTNAGPFGIVYGFKTNAFNSRHSASHLNDIDQNTWRLAPSPMDQCHTSSNHLPSWPAYPTPDIDFDPFIVEEPRKIDPFSHREESPTPGGSQQLATPRKGYS